MICDIDKKQDIYIIIKYTFIYKIFPGCVFIRINSHGSKDKDVVCLVVYALLYVIQHQVLCMCKCVYYIQLYGLTL